MNTASPSRPPVPDATEWAFPLGTPLSPGFTERHSPEREGAVGVTYLSIAWLGPGPGSGLPAMLPSSERGTSGLFRPQGSLLMVQIE